MVEKKQINFPRYEHYKDSGIDWIGEIPAHWGLSKFKFIATFEKASLPKRLVGDSNYPVYMTMDYLRGGKAAQWVLDRTAKVVEKGEVLLLWDGANAGEFIKSRRGVPPSTVAHIIFLNIEKSFGWYFTSVIERQLRLTTVGMGIPHVSGLELSNNLVTIPPLPEQTAIAQFLDHKTAQIDRAIAIKEAQIKLLNERKQIMIQEAVTKGLDPSAPMKDSGIEWIGEIPAHWEVKKLKYVIKEPLQYGASETGIEYRSNLPRYIRITDFSSNGGLNNESKLSLNWNDAKGYLLSDNDILFARSGATVGKSYQFKVKLSEDKYHAFAGYLIRVSADENIIYSDYLYCYVNSNLFQNWRALIYNKATIENIGADKYAQLPIILPNLIEQKNILDFLSYVSKPILKSINNLQTQIQTLKEYKTTLINEAVTGKIKVY